MQQSDLIMLKLMNMNMSMRLKWDESQHPREPAGTSIGGQFASETEGESINSFEENIRTKKIESSAYYKDGKQILSKNGDKTEVEFTDDEIALMNGGILTHNHPIPRSFSGEDILFFNSQKLDEIRAVGPGVNYSMKSNGVFVSDNILESEINKQSARITTEYFAAIKEGSLTIQDANKYLHHDVNKAIAKLYGWTYSRKIIDKTFYSSIE